MNLEKKYNNIIKVIYNKSLADISLSGVKLKVFDLKSGARQGWTLLLLLFNIVLTGFRRAIWPKWEKKKKLIQIRNEELKWSSFAQDIENPEGSPQKC